jgi:hypothetical protein
MEKYGIKSIHYFSLKNFPSMSKELKVNVHYIVRKTLLFLSQIRRYEYLGYCSQDRESIPINSAEINWFEA